MVVLLLALARAADLFCNSDREAGLPYSRTDDAVICLQFLPQMKRLAFKVIVDKYSALHGSGVFTAFQGTPTTLLPQLENTPLTDASTSYPYITNVLRVSNIYSFVIRLDQGVFVNITDDNQCLSCNETCEKVDIITYENCVETVNVSQSGGYYDPRVFISWIGTDADGNHLQSSAQRFARFQAYSISRINFQSLISSID